MRQSPANPFLEPGDIKLGSAASEVQPVAADVPLASEAAPNREPVAAASFAEDAKVASAARALEEGRAFAVIVENDPSASARLVADLAHLLVARGVSVTVVGNVTPWPLTLDKLIAQVGGEPGADPAQLLREAVAGPFGARHGAVLVIDQADTLDDRALGFLAELSTALRASGSQFQLVFAGRDSLLPKLSAHSFVAGRPLVSRLLGAPRAGAAAAVAACAVVLAIVGVSLAGGARTTIPAPPSVTAASQPTTGSVAPAPAATQDQAAAMQPADGGVVAQSAGAMVPPTSAAAPPAPEPAAAIAPAPATSAQPSVAGPTDLTPPSSPEPSVKTREAALRHDFSTFLDRSGVQTARLSPAQRDQLFKDYLVWRLRPVGSSTAPDPP